MDNIFNFDGDKFPNCKILQIVLSDVFSEKIQELNEKKKQLAELVVLYQRLSSEFDKKAVKASSIKDLSEIDLTKMHELEKEFTSLRNEFSLDSELLRLIYYVPIHLN